MNKRTLTLVVVLTAVLLFAAISAVSAKSNGPIECDLDISYNGSFWFGTVVGHECSVEGTIRFDAVPEEYFDAGRTTHFVETFTIWPAAGGEIHGKNYGVWNFSTFKFRANGWVTGASDEWAHLVGNKYHESGTTSNPADGLPLTTSGGSMKIVPANRHNTP